MIYFKLRLTNPWSPLWELLKTTSGLFTKNKAWEFNVYASNELLGVEFEYTTRTDHAGVGLTLSFFNYTLEYKIYDVRHWDYTENKWSDIKINESKDWGNFQ